MKKLFGIDFGTGGCKATVIDLKGNICATAFQEYPSEHLKPGWSEQDPALWLEAFVNTVQSCKGQMADGFDGVLGMAVSASAHNVVLLDADGQVIRHCIMWNDQRSADQCQRLQRDHGQRIFDIAMAMPTPTWTLPQLMWIKETEPENYARIHRIMFTKDYIRSWITGDFCTDVVDAQGSLFFDARAGQWSKELCELIDLPMSALPQVRRSKDIVGTVQPEAARITGLPQGLPVIAGCSDTAAEDFSAGAVRPGQIIVKLATAGNVNMVAAQGDPHAKTFTYPYSVEGLWYTVTATSAAASAYRWMRDALYPAEKAQCDAAGEDVYLKMDADAAKAELGSRGLIFHPYLSGERCPLFDPNARGSFFGASMVHEKAHFARALLEGVAFSLYDCLSVLKQFNTDFSDIALIGGGAKSSLWSQIISDVFGLEVKIPEHAESSFGGALLVGVGVGAFASEQEAAEKCIRMKKIFRPDMQAHQKYMELFAIYRQIAQASAPIWQELAKIAG